MAICIPPAGAATFTSKAEKRLFAAFATQLGDEFLVLHSVGWIGKPKGEGPRDGETDFLVCHPRLGILVVEVKGGRIDLNYANRSWTSTDGDDIVHVINNPFEQAMRGKYGVLEKLKESPQWRRLGIRRVTLGHAAFFPDIGDGARLRGPDAPREIIGDRSDMQSLQQWVVQALEYWSSRPGEDRQAGAPTPAGIDVVRRIFARVANTRPLLSARIEDEERERIELTGRQALILDMLSRQRKVMVAGGAGTGKTLIAREKAVRAADEGLSTLLVCYNRGLADHLREQCTGVEKLEVASFHQLCSRWIGKAKSELGRDLLAEVRRDHPGGNEYDHHQPIALALAIDLLGVQFDAVVVDEAQDFGDEFWMPIEMLLSDHERGLLYVFLDENQDIYGRSAAVPIAGDPMVLDRNCRNTDRIHAAAYRYYKGAAVEAPAIAGVDIEMIAGSDVARQAKAIGSLITRLIVDERVKPHEIGVLICDPGVRDACERELKSTPIPGPAKFGRLEAYAPNVVTVDTVAKFKGLERPVVILWGLDACSPDRNRETLYVGMSRAKSSLFLCGTRNACERVAKG